MDIQIIGALITTDHVHQPAQKGTGEQMKTTVVKSSGLVSGIPCITADAAYRMLRRHAVNVALKELMNSAQGISSFVRHCLGYGDVEGRHGDGEVVRISENMFRSLFGSGGSDENLRLQFDSDLVPLLKRLTLEFLPDSVRQYAIDATPEELLSSVPIEQFSLEEDVEAYKRYVAKVAGQEAADQVDTEDLDEWKSDEDEVTVRECLSIGTPLFFSLHARGVSEAQAGLVLRAMAEWVDRNTLGGAAPPDGGSFEPCLSLHIDGEDDPVVVELFQQQVRGTSYKLVSHPRIDSMLTACRNALPTELSSVIQGMFTTA